MVSKSLIGRLNGNSTKIVQVVVVKTFPFMSANVSDERPLGNQDEDNPRVRVGLASCKIIRLRWKSGAGRCNLGRGGVSRLPP